MKGIKLFMFALFVILIACWAPLVFAADMLPAHEATAFTIPGLPATATPGNLLLWMIVTVLGFLYTVITESLPFIKSCKFNGIADFFVQAFKALVVNPTPDTTRLELDALKQTVTALSTKGTGVSADWLNTMQEEVAKVVTSALNPPAPIVTQEAAAAIQAAAPIDQVAPAPAAAPVAAPIPAAPAPAAAAIDQSAPAAAAVQGVTNA